MTTAPSILAAKLFMPALRPGLVARPRLTQRLSAVWTPGGKLAVVSAPAGYGKTTLLAEWMQSVSGQAACVNLDAGDNDPARFTAHLIAAVGGLRPGAGETALAMLGAPLGALPLEAALGSLVNDLAGASGANLAAVVLDDFHAVAAPEVHNAVNFLIDHLPADFRLVVAGRAEPPLALALLRARGQLVEIGRADLSFTEDEAAEFLIGSLGLALAPEQVAALEQRSEGWAVGLQLAGLALQAAPEPPSAAQLSDINGRHRYIADYLVGEVLDRQPERVRQFLLHTAALERFCASLCDAVVGVSDSTALLDQLDRAHLFLIPLDAERRWYRYHHLFAEALQAQVRRMQPEIEGEIHRRASEWLADNQHLPEAIHHALAGRDLVSAARLIDRASHRAIRLGRVATIRAWLAALPAELVMADAALCVWQSWTMVDEGRFTDMEPFLHSAEAGLAAETPSDDEARQRLASLAGQVRLIRSQQAFSRGQAESGLQAARRAWQQLPARDIALRSFVALLVGRSLLDRGEPLAAEEHLLDAYRTIQAAFHPFIRLQIADGLVAARAMQGRLRAAAEVGGEALALAEVQGLAGQAGRLREWLARIALHQHDLPVVEQHAAALAERVAPAGYPQGALTAHQLRAMLALAQGQPAKADEQLAAAERIVSTYHGSRPPRWWLEWLADFWLTAGEPGRARAAMGHPEAGPADHAHEHSRWMLARLLVAEGRPREALALLNPQRDVAEAAGRGGSVLRCRVVQAAAHQALGHVPQALRVLAGAIDLAAPEGSVRVFLKQGPGVLALLRQFPAAHTKRPFIDRVLLLAGLDAPVSAAAAVTAGKDPDQLTAREREILTLLAAGLSNDDIAARLVVAVSTVRWYSKQLYRKLDVHNRTQAVLRAQALGLV